MSRKRNLFCSREKRRLSERFQPCEFLFSIKIAARFPFREPSASLSVRHAPAALLLVFSISRSKMHVCIRLISRPIDRLNYNISSFLIQSYNKIAAMKKNDSRNEKRAPSKANRFRRRSSCLLAFRAFGRNQPSALVPFRTQNLQRAQKCVGEIEPPFPVPPFKRGTQGKQSKKGLSVYRSYCKIFFKNEAPPEGGTLIC